MQFEITRTPRRVAALAAAVTAAAAQAPPAGHSHPAREPGPAAAAAPSLRLIDVSLNLVTAAGASTARDDELELLQGGSHDPRQRGFTLQQAELGMAGAVEDWFEVEALLTYGITPGDGETEVELEEAFLTTSSLPAGLEVKAGHYLTEFGRNNPTHPHSWWFVNQPVIVTRVLGPDGMRAPGARLRWRPEGASASLLVGVQDASGETVPSFLANEELYAGGGVGGRFFTEREVRSFGDFAWSTRVVCDLVADAHRSLSVGASLTYGPNPTGSSADTFVYGADFEYVWQQDPDDVRAPAFAVTGEFAARDFEAADQVDLNDPANAGDDVPIPGAVLRDRGGYLQAVYGFGGGFGAGLRGEWATGSGLSYDQVADTFSRAGDAFRDDRVRLSPLLVYRWNEHSRVRLQYDYDDADHLDGDAHSVWLGVVVSIGRHGAHDY